VLDIEPWTQVLVGIGEQSSWESFTAGAACPDAPIHPFWHTA
jgi:hypothetical protein